MRIFIIMVLLFGFVLRSHAQEEEKHYLIPTRDYVQILEHTCIKHIDAGRIRRAHEVLGVANWQCLNREFFDLGELSQAKTQNDIEIYRAKLKEAQTKKEQNPSKWICDPPPLELPSAKRNFYQNYVPTIRDYLKQRGIDEDGASLILSQIIQETAWGTRIVGNNLFNIKGEYQGESVVFTTHEP